MSTGNQPSGTDNEPDRVALYRQQLARAAGQGALMEIIMRMTAEVIPATRSVAHDPSYKAVELAVCNYLAARDRITEAEREQLRQCREMRNRLMHANLRVTRERSRDLGSPPVGGGVISIPLPDINAGGAAILDAILNFTNATPVADHSKRGIFGWLLELGTAGDLEYVEQQFREGIALVDDLVVRMNEVFAAEQSAVSGA